MSNNFIVDNSGNVTVSGTISVDGYVINPSNSSVGQVLQYNGSAYAPVFIQESDVTNLTSDLASKVSTSRLINTNARLTGGGDLTVDRTLDLATSGVSAGTYQGITLDAYGRATSASNQNYLTTIVNASAQEVLGATTANQYMTVLNYTTPSAGNYYVGVYIRLLSSGVGDVKLLYTDASNSQRTIDLYGGNTYPSNHGDYSMHAFVNCANNTAITIQVESPFNVTNNLRCSASIVQMS